MISLARVSAKMGRSYYTADAYYTKENCVENSKWYGKGAEFLALKGEIDPVVFQKLLEGQITEKIGLKSHQSGQNLDKKLSRRPAIDLTFSAPKSVSLASLVGGDNRIIEAHQNSVNSALKLVEARYSWTRTGNNLDRKIEVSQNIIAAQFLHDVSRAKDPQLHTHCVVINAVQRQDGKWRSLHNDGIFENSKLIGLVYQNELACELQNLGYEIDRKQNGTFEIKGYSSEQIQEFSKRTKHIRDLNCKTKKQERVEKLLDRPSKGKNVSRETLRETWTKESKNINLSHPIPNISNHFDTQKITPKEILQSGILHLEERDVRFTKEDIEKFSLEQNLGSVSFSSFDESFQNLKKSNELIEYKKGFFTTHQAIFIENRMLDNIQFGKEKFDPIAHEIPAQITNNEFNLTKGQSDALALSLQSKDQFIAWQGVAGAGKTFAMNILREICEQKSVAIKGFAPSAEAAKVLTNESLIPSNTVASLLCENQPSGKSKNNKELWIVDEASLLSARDCDKLIEKASIENARVIFVGDTKQMSAIEAGNPFKLMQEHGIKIAHLTESRRQKNQSLKSAVDAVAKGKIADGVKFLEPSILEYRGAESRINFISREYLKLNESERDKTMILSSTNKERFGITNGIRNELKANNRLINAVPIQVLQSKHLTREQMRYAHYYAINNVLVFHKANQCAGIAQDKPYIIEGIDHSKQTLTLKNTDNLNTNIIQIRTGGFQLYQTKQIDIGVGERIKCTRNIKETGMRNGQTYHVISTQDKMITLSDKNGKSLMLPTEKFQHFDYNYANTIYSSQGKTCDRVFIVDDGNFGKESFYVALSRAKQSATILTENKNEFLNSVSASHTKISALDIVKKMNKEYGVSKPCLVKEINQNGISKRAYKI